MDLAAQILAPKNTFLCSVVFQQKTHGGSHQWFHNASNYFWNGFDDKNEDKREKTMRKKGINLFKYIMDHANVWFFF